MTSKYIEASSEIIKTLETIIAPGNRTRLSPFVESAQYYVLTGTWPDETRRAVSSKEIIENNDDTFKKITNKWTYFFNNQDKDFAANDYSEKYFLDGYLSYYFSVNVCKIQLVLLDLLRLGKLRKDLSILDIGVGTGTTLISVLDFIITLGDVYRIYNHNFPFENINYLGVDQSRFALDYSKKVIIAYKDSIKRYEIKLHSGGKNKFNNSQVPIQRILEWSEQFQWQALDLNRDKKRIDHYYDFIVASNVFNELKKQDKDGVKRLEDYITTLPQFGNAIIIDPGDKESAQKLMTWRKKLVRNNPKFISLAPCGELLNNPIVHSPCETCWCSRRETFHQNIIYHEFLKRITLLNGETRNTDEYTNKLLSWSYVVLENAGISFGSKNDMGGNIHKGIETRYVGHYKEKEKGEYTHADSLIDNHFNDKQSDEYLEFIKLCACSMDGISSAAIKRRPGYIINPLQFGEKIKIEGFSERKVEYPLGNVLFYEPKNGDISKINKIDIVGQDDLSNQFINLYNETTQAGINSLGYRLFGFPQMYPQQHQILERVLTGKNILGIAATGGGKSECYILPAILLSGVTIVISPLKSLMYDQYEQRICNRYGLSDLTTYINGDVPINERHARLKRMELGYYKLVYFTPEQLERSYVLESIKRANDFAGVRYLAIDEAHCISQWGHDFRPSYLNIIHRFKSYDITPSIIALTATASPNVRQDICEELGLINKSIQDGGDVFIHSSNRPELNLVVRVKSTTKEKVEDILDELHGFNRNNAKNMRPGAALIFMPTTGGHPDEKFYLPDNNNDKHSKKGMNSAGVTRFASFLERKLEKKLAIYHGKMENDDNLNIFIDNDKNKQLGDLSGRTRQNEQNSFICNDRDIMVATKGFGMGVDKDNIRLILHRTPPGNLEAYAQESGRAGRDGDPAKVVLYYSPDSPEEAEPSYGKETKLLQSDNAIQTFFLSEKYIRRIDIEIMYAFIKTIKNNYKIKNNNGEFNNYCYFTSDEAIDYLDKSCINHSALGLPYPYEWPKFNLNRNKFGHESDEHKIILDKGHLYNLKNKYLNRIISSLYRIRPDVDGTTKMSFFRSAHNTGAKIVKFQNVKWEKITKSNMYFCNILGNITEDEFLSGIRENNLINLSKILNITIHELSLLLNDIRFCEGKFINNKWNPDLISYSFIGVPYQGPLLGKDDNLSEIRNYRGAIKRASKQEAHRRAEKANRKKYHNGKNNVDEYSTTIDDWFGYQEICNAEGWEVQIGSAVEYNNFNKYLDIFMELHDRRKEQDWASYNRLLTDYIGVMDDGSLPINSSKKECLRSVLLGYLQSNEVVVGGNCYSCNRCVPDENFDKYTIEQKRNAIMHLPYEVVDLLNKLITQNSKIPDEEQERLLFEYIEKEEEKERSLRNYFIGWSSRILDDTPDHLTALWLRLKAMRLNILEMQTKLFIIDANAIQKNLKRNKFRRFIDLLEAVSNHFENDPEYWKLLKTSNKSINDIDGEIFSLEMLIHLLLKNYKPSQEIYELSKDLSNLYKVQNNRKEFEKWSIFAAKYAKNEIQAMESYKEVILDWTTEEIVEHTNKCIEMNVNIFVVYGLLKAWLSFNRKIHIISLKQVFSNISKDVSNINWFSKFVNVSENEEVDIHWIKINLCFYYELLLPCENIVHSLEFIYQNSNINEKELFTNVIIDVPCQISSDPKYILFLQKIYKNENSIEQEMNVLIELLLSDLSSTKEVKSHLFDLYKRLIVVKKDNSDDEGLMLKIKLNVARHCSDYQNSFKLFQTIFRDKEWEDIEEELYYQVENDIDIDVSVALILSWYKHATNERNKQIQEWINNNINNSSSLQPIAKSIFDNKFM